MKTKTVATEIAALVGAIYRCEEDGNTEWADKHQRVLSKIEKELLPSGSGFNCGTDIALDMCVNQHLVFTTSFHHMDEHGGYNGWTDHNIIVTPEFGTINVRVTGKDRNQIKGYIAEVFYQALNAEFDYTQFAEAIYKEQA